MMLYTLRFARSYATARYAKNLDSIHADAVAAQSGEATDRGYTQPFEVSKFKDHYEEALRELVEAKINNLPVPEPEAEKKPGKVIDLMEALRKSLAQTNPAQGAQSQSAPRIPRLPTN